MAGLANFSSDPGSAKLMVQVSVGSFALLVNVVILLILITDQKLFKKSAFLFGLALGNLFVALAFAVSSAYRIAETIFGTASVKVTVSYCLTTMVPEFYYLAFCTPALVLLAIGAERLIAVACATWYYSKWAPEKNWYVLAIVYICVFVSVSAASVYGFLYIPPGGKITRQCLWTFVAGDGFTGYFYIVSIVGGSCAVVATLVSFNIGRHRLKRLPKVYTLREARRRAQKQLQLTKAMLSVACLDFTLVVLPNMFLLLGVVFHVALPFNVNNTPLYAYNANAVLNMLAHVVFNSEFRTSTIRFFRLDRFAWFKNTATTAVAPIEMSSQRRIVVEQVGQAQTYH